MNNVVDSTNRVLDSLDALNEKLKERLKRLEAISRTINAIELSFNDNGFKQVISYPDALSIEALQGYLRWQEWGEKRNYRLILYYQDSLGGMVERPFSEAPGEVRVKFYEYLEPFLQEVNKAVK